MRYYLFLLIFLSVSPRSSAQDKVNFGLNFGGSAIPLSANIGLNLDIYKFDIYATYQVPFDYTQSFLIGTNYEQRFKTNNLSLILDLQFQRRINGYYYYFDEDLNKEWQFFLGRRNYFNSSIGIRLRANDKENKAFIEFGHFDFTVGYRNSISKGNMEELISGASKKQMDRIVRNYGSTILIGISLNFEINFGNKKS